MRGSFRFARVFGIDLKIHFTFLIIVLLVAMPAKGLAATAFAVSFVLLLFACVTLHELGHAWVALRYGIPVREIVLLPIGGVAVMARIPQNPKQELWIAVAGPLVNVIILAVLVPIWFLLLGGFSGMEALQDQLIGASRLQMNDPGSFGLRMLTMLIGANIMLIVFNLIPAFPLDGGRILRATLAFFMPHPRATRIAASVGQVFAVIFAIFGLASGHIMLAIIAFFIFMGAGAESAAAQTGTVLSTKRVGDAYNKTALTLTIDSRVSHVIEHLLTSYQPDFAVFNRGRFVGVVTRDDVLKWLAETPSLYDVYVTEVMREAEQVPRVDARMTLDEVTQFMEEKQTRIVTVFDGELYLGLVSAEDIAEAQAVLTFLNRWLAEAGAVPVQSPWPVPMREAR